MSLSNFKTRHAFILAIVVSVLLILRQYTDYLINDYGYEFSWFAVSAKITLNYLLWAGMIRLLLKIANHLLTNRLSFVRVVQHIGISLGIALVHRILSVRLYDLSYYAYSGFLRSFFTPGNKVQYGAGLFSSFLEYWIIMVLIVAFAYYLRSSRQEKELNAAKLKALQMQLHPHFLFNTLNSISSLIDIDKKKAQKMLAQLGFLMREMLAHDKRHFISLENELKYIKTYLEIEHIRFQDRLSLNFQIDERLLQAQVPALLLQPLAENAIKHGISKHPDGGEIVVKVNKRTKNGEDFLHLHVSNDCSSLNGSEKDHGFGIGTRNISNRLTQLYGEQHTYTHFKEKNTYISEILLPLYLIS